MNRYRITGKRIFTEKGTFEPGTLFLFGERILTEEDYEQSVAPEQIIDVGDHYVIPGLMDIHFHGCMGVDSCDGTGDVFVSQARYEARQGVTAITPATMTMPEAVLMKIAEAAKSYGENPVKDGADFCGLYMEGPFISEAKKGAQKGEYIIKANEEMYRRLQEASGGRIRTLVIAPETEGALSFIKRISQEVNISMGHTMADYETTQKAIACGASQVTHLYNAMPPFTHREPGPVGAAADDDKCMVELICDGVHIHPSVVRNTFRMFGDDRIVMISDSMRATGMPDGESELGGQTVYVNGKYARLKDGTLAGSVTNLMNCLRTAVNEMGIPLGSAVKCATINPAKAIRMDQDYGSLKPGKYANIVILDENLMCRNVFVHGEIVK